MRVMSMFTDWFQSKVIYEIGSYRLSEEEKISEGGYGYIYRVTDTKSGQQYALKKVLLQVFNMCN